LWLLESGRHEYKANGLNLVTVNTDGLLSGFESVCGGEDGVVVVWQRQAKLPVTPRHGWLLVTLRAAHLHHRTRQDGRRAVRCRDTKNLSLHRSLLGGTGGQQKHGQNDGKEHRTPRTGQK